MLNGMQLVTIPIDHKWKPFTVITRIREIIASQNSTHVFIGAWTVSTRSANQRTAAPTTHTLLVILKLAGLPRYRAGCCGYYGFILRVPCD